MSNRIQSERNALAAFVRELAQNLWSGTVDGFALQDLMEKHGLLLHTAYDPDLHGPNDVGAERGCSWFVLTDLAKPAPVDDTP